MEQESFDNQSEAESIAIGEQGQLFTIEEVKSATERAIEYIRELRAQEARDIAAYEKRRRDLTVPYAYAGRRRRSRRARETL